MYIVHRWNCVHVVIILKGMVPYLKEDIKGISLFFLSIILLSPFFKCQKIQDNSNLFVRWKFNQKKFVKSRHFHVILQIYIFVLCTAFYTLEMNWITCTIFFYFWKSKRMMTNFLRTIQYHYSIFQSACWKRWKRNNSSQKRSLISRLDFLTMQKSGWQV